MFREGHPAVFVALLCLLGAVVEARRIRAGRRESRPWFALLVATAALSTVWAVQDLMRR